MIGFHGNLQASRIQESCEMFGRRPNLFTFPGITAAFCLALLSGCFYDDGSTPPTQSAAAASGSDTSSTPPPTSVTIPPSSSSGGSSAPASMSGNPAVPTNLNASSGNASVTLTWSASDGASSYDVQRAISSGGPYVQIAAVLTTSYADTAVTNGTSYYYVVTAVNSVGESAGSSSVSALPTAPAGSPSIAVTPTLPVTPYGGKLQFVGVLSGASGATIVWSMRETGNVGTITSTGLYTAPTVAGTYHVVATSSLDSQLTAAAAVTVTAPLGNVPALTAGVWTNITPPASPAGLPQWFGFAEIEIDPSNPNVLYACADQLGIWKSTNRGGSWTLLGTPPAVAASPSNSYTTPYLDSPIEIRVDPADSTHLIATQGVRGTAQGFWVSHNGGVTWTMPTAFYTLARSTTTADVTQIAVDPTSFNHILVMSHSPWVGLGNGGVMETTDGGTTWTAHAPVAGWPTGSAGVGFAYDPPNSQGNSATWLVGTDGDGYWRTTNSGGSWTQVSANSSGHGGASFSYTPAGVLYTGGTGYPQRSTDNGVTWTTVSTGLPYRYYYNVWNDGTTLYTSPSYPSTIGGGGSGAGQQPMFVSAITDGATYTGFKGGAQTWDNGPFSMRFDATNCIIYTANWANGVWATKPLTC
jgi:hypothetical protein